MHDIGEKIIDYTQDAPTVIIAFVLAKAGVVRSVPALRWSSPSDHGERTFLCMLNAVLEDKTSCIAEHHCSS